MEAKDKELLEKAVQKVIEFKRSLDENDDEEINWDSVIKELGKEFDELELGTLKTLDDKYPEAVLWTVVIEYSKEVLKDETELENFMACVDRAKA